MTGIANVRYGQTDMPYSGEHQTLTYQSMRHVYTGDICCTTLSGSSQMG